MIRPALAQEAGMPELPPGAPAELLVGGLIMDFGAFHERCRGGLGDDPDTWNACGSRDYAGYLLGQIGVCLGTSGDPGDWMFCTEGGSRLGRPPS